MSEETKLKYLEQINKKMDLLILLTSLQGQSEKEKIRILKNVKKSEFSKRELEKITGIDRHKF